MKAFFGASILAAAIVGGVVWKAVGASSALEERQSQRLLADSTAALDSVVARLNQIEDRLGALETELGDQGRTNTDLEARKVAATVSLESDSAKPDAENAIASTPRLKGMNEEDVQELRAMIADVYIQERNQRKEREKEEALLAAREREEMMKGPYGDHNYRVNSLGKKLSLSDYQKSRYHEALVSHRQRLKEQQAGLNLSDAASRENWNNRRRSLEDDFQSTVITLLSPEQAEAYEALEQGDKVGNDGAVKFMRTMQLGENGEMQVDVTAVGEGTAGVGIPLPPEMLKGGATRLPLGLPGGGGAVVTGDDAGIVIERLVGPEAKAQVIQVKPAR